MIVRKYEEKDLTEMALIWNQVVEDGIAFPQTDLLDHNSAKAFFEGQTYNGVAEEDDGTLSGLYILHPNNVGRCGHIANASYCVKRDRRGRGTGRKLVLDSLKQAKEHGFLILQFNAVVESNYNARKLYEKLGFVPLGVIPSGFLMKDGHYENIIPYYYDLREMR